MEWRTSLQNHNEIRTNPLFATKKGKTVFAQIKVELRRAVVTRIGEFLKTILNDEQAHGTYQKKMQNKTIAQTNNFRKRAQYYNDPDDDDDKFDRTE